MSDVKQGFQFLRITSHALILAMGILAAGCADPVGPSVDDVSPRTIKEVDGKLYVLNFTLHAIDDPNIAPAPRAEGHLQLKLVVMGDGSVRIAIKGHIMNPDGEHFTGLTIENSGLGGRGALFIGLGEVDGRGGPLVAIDPEDATIPAELAAMLFGTPDTIDDPNLLVVTFFSVEHKLGALRGTLALPAVQ